MDIYHTQRLDVERLIWHGLNRFTPEQAVSSCVSRNDNRLQIDKRSYDTESFQRLWVFGCGKASARMALKMEDILADDIYGGFVVCPYGQKTTTRRIEQFEAAHPVPDHHSLAAAEKMIKVASDVQPDDLVLFLLSGGASSLLCLPSEKLTLDDISGLYRALLQSGAPIRDMNRIRKSVSRLKGGKLRPFFSSKVIEMLAISDVPNNDPAVIGSGPLVEDPVDAKEALSLMGFYGLDKKVPSKVLQFLKDKADDSPSNRKEKKMQETTHVTILASAEGLAREIRNAAESLGYHAICNESFLTGESREAAAAIVEESIRIRNRGILPAACIYFGETTVTVKGNGKGGRNQEMALAAALYLEGVHHITFLSIGTDGRDGETSAAGAVVNGHSARKARRMNLNPEPFLHNNDSWTFFNETDGLFVTGVTGNNLMDIQIVLIDT